MRSSLSFFPAKFLAGVALLTVPLVLHSQEAGAGPIVASLDVPDAPLPQISVDVVVANSNARSSTDQDQSSQQTSPNSTTVANPAGQGSSSSQAPAQQSPDGKSEREKAADQLKEQEHQRVAGVMATFNTTSNRNALPLSPGQKFQLFFKSSTDPWPFLLAGVVSGIGQADDSYPAWGQGMQGYAKRYGAAYGDSFIGNFFGNAVLPSLLHEDPRYFQKGTGRAMTRFLWAASSTVWCRRDKGTWGPNYSNVGGNLIGAAIARAYYPSSDRTVSDTIDDGLTVSAEGIVGAEVIEFWPDLARHIKRKRAEKLARQAAAQDASGAAAGAPAAQSAPPQK